jgi:hypothetical protein
MYIADVSLFMKFAPNKHIHLLITIQDSLSFASVSTV